MNIDQAIANLRSAPESPTLTEQQAEVYRTAIAEYTQRNYGSLQWGQIIDKRLQEAGCSAETAYFYTLARYRFAGVAAH